MFADVFNLKAHQMQTHTTQELINKLNSMREKLDDIQYLSASMLFMENELQELKPVYQQLQNYKRKYFLFLQLLSARIIKD